MKKNHCIHWAWIILITCFFNLFINYSIRLGYAVVLPEMIRDLGFSRTAGGSIYNAYLFAYVALTPLTGFLTDRLGGRRVITTCALILGTGVLLMGSVHTLPMACLYFGIAGLGSTGMWTPVITVVQRWFSLDRRGMALGILSTGYGLGFATMGMAFPVIVDHFNWRFAWYFLGCGALTMVLANGLLLRSNPESTGHLPWGQKDAADSIYIAQETDFDHGRSVRRAFRDRTFWLIGASYFCLSYCLYGITTFMVDYAKHEIGLPLAKASFLATIHGICQIIGVLTILPLSDYLGRRKTIILSDFCITISLVGILFSGNSWLMLDILIGILAVFYGATFPIYGACAGDYFPKQVMGTVIGAWTPFYGGGAILANWMGGILRDTTGSYMIAFIINAAMAAIGFGLFLKVKKAP
ncbi:MAG: MFS transporter, partial [Deltaproteobacteria bacterium]|nr:MFS transporter [Deltaproteobacteria bacterium]